MTIENHIEQVLIAKLEVPKYAYRPDVRDLAALNRVNLSDSEFKRLKDDPVTADTHHFNMLRSILGKTATFFGYMDFANCLGTGGDEGLHACALNLLSHGKYSLYEAREMVEDHKALFREILTGFLARYAFALPMLEAQAVGAQLP